jgi:hypothetical protein
MGHHSIVLEQRACDDLDVQPGFLADLADRSLGERLPGGQVAACSLGCSSLSVILMMRGRRGGLGALDGGLL